MKKFTNILCIILATCALALYVLPMKHNGRIARIPTSEVLADDEVVYNSWMGISGSTIQPSYDASWGNGCAFITASGVRGGSSETYATDYYDDARCYYRITNSPKLFSGAMYSGDFSGWWGGEIFPPFTAFSIPDLGTDEQKVNAIAAAMAPGCGLICVDNGEGDEGHVWAMLRIQLHSPNGVDRRTGLPNTAYTIDYDGINAMYDLDLHMTQNGATYDSFLSLFIDTQYCYLTE